VAQADKVAVAVSAKITRLIVMLHSIECDRPLQATAISTRCQQSLCQSSRARVFNGFEALPPLRRHQDSQNAHIALSFCKALQLHYGNPDSVITRISANSQIGTISAFFGKSDLQKRKTWFVPAF
jgi:hypothetical protein